ncbi:Hypothetical_protein [Hexamita inflata]|uniref:Hypothetical_protein n=1 Tax=Hexamita inflata TaxID=28002 RepID=A0ABP1H697_9EUKA
MNAYTVVMSWLLSCLNWSSSSFALQLFFCSFLSISSRFLIQCAVTLSTIAFQLISLQNELGQLFCVYSNSICLCINSYFDFACSSSSSRSSASYLNSSVKFSSCSASFDWSVLSCSSTWRSYFVRALYLFFSAVIFSSCKRRSAFSASSVCKY